MQGVQELRCSVGSARSALAWLNSIAFWELRCWVAVPLTQAAHLLQANDWALLRQMFAAVGPADMDAYIEDLSRPGAPPPPFLHLWPMRWWQHRKLALSA
jgi:hypothetical protein